jgi:DNA-binding NtrC family response regulator
MRQGSEPARLTPAADSGQPDAAAATRVLVVDDDPDVLAVYTEILAETGYAVDSASDGFRAIEFLSAKSYDVIVSDIAMPGMDGIQFLRAVRDFDLDVPVILSTGNPALETAVRAVEEGAFRYLFKRVCTPSHASSGNRSSCSARAAGRWATVPASNRALDAPSRHCGWPSSR